jgi:predicted O-methyltransferase YrrM
MLSEITAVFGILLFLAAGFVAIYHYRKIAGKWMHETRELLRQSLQQQRRGQEQTQSLFSIFNLLKLNHPLPAMSGWAIQPDFAKYLLAEILDLRPGLILETGSGVSTLIAAYALKRNGKGLLISLEHEEAYALKNRRELELHGLSDIAKIIHAPFKDYMIEGETWPWYSLENVESMPVDMVIVDGPPAATRPLARYPALPLLEKRLSRKATLILDDTGRKEEQEIIKRWSEQFRDFEAESVDTEKGMVFLRRK